MSQVVAALPISRAKTDSPTTRTIAKIYRSNLIVVDNIGLLPLSHKTTEAFYHPIDAAYEHHLSPSPSTSIPPSSTRSSPKPPPHAPRTHGQDQR
ncbi:ATP-binding protein [Nonomuraea sp. NPDC003707]